MCVSLEEYERQSALKLRLLRMSNKRLERLGKRYQESQPWLTSLCKQILIGRGAAQ